MNTLDFYLKKALELGASDIFIMAGTPISVRVNRKIITVDDYRLKSSDSLELVTKMYEMAYKKFKLPTGSLDDEISFNVKEVSRFRASIFKQHGAVGAILKILGSRVPTAEELGIPDNVMKIAKMNQGLVLISGSSSSGVTSTLASIIDRMNKNREIHIIIFEDIIEYMHKSDKALITQREIGNDTVNYSSAIRYSLRQSPDIVVLNSFKDLDVVRTALSMAEMGYLIIATVPRLGVANTIEQVINQFPESDEAEIAVRLSNVIRAVISQQLITTNENKKVPVFDVIFDNDEMRKSIVKMNYKELNDIILRSKDSRDNGSTSMNETLREMMENGIITKEVYNRKRMHIH